METGLKALNHALPGPHPPRTHDLAALIDVLSVAAGERDRLAAAVEGLDLEEAALWREMGTYPGDFEAEVVAGRSTSEHAAKMVNAASRLTLAVVDLAEDRIGESDASREVRAELDRLAGPCPAWGPVPASSVTPRRVPTLYHGGPLEAANRASGNSSQARM